MSNDVDDLSDSDDVDDLINFCADLVTSENSEVFPLTLLTLHRLGNWVSVGKLCHDLGITNTEVKDDLVVTWLDDPDFNHDYIVIVFYDNNSKFTFGVHYNKSRLLSSIQTPVSKSDRSEEPEEPGRPGRLLPPGSTTSELLADSP